MADNKKDTLERARRTSGYTETLTAGDLTLRPFSLATMEHIQSLGLQALIPGSGAPVPKSDAEFVNLIFGVAWTLWAPLETVNSLCLDLEYAVNKAEKTRLEKEFRREILTFKAKVPTASAKTLIQNLCRVLKQIGELDFDVIDRTDAAGDSETPPGNS